MGKNAIGQIKRLEAVDDCLRKFAKPMNIKQITKACNDALNINVTERQYKYDIENIRDKYDVGIREDKIDGKKTYVYEDEGFSIKGDKEIGQVEMLNFRKIRDALIQFSGLNLDANLNEITDEIDKMLGYDKNDKAVISFEKTVLENHGKVKPDKLLPKILQSIIQHQPLDVKYEVPNRGKRDWVVFPQFLKQYNQRWYLIALIHHKEEDKLQNIALDRIISMQPNQHIPYKQSDIDFAEYFEDVVGVTKPEGAEPIEVKLRVERGEYPYLESKPIHKSQKKVEATIEHIYVTLTVYDNYELRSKLLSYGSKVTVMEPVSLRDKLRDELQKALGNYNEK